MSPLFWLDSSFTGTKTLVSFGEYFCLYLVNLGVLFLSSLVPSMLEFIGSGFELYLSKDGPSYVSICSYSTYGFLTFIPGSILVFRFNSINIYAVGLVTIKTCT